MTLKRLLAYAGAASILIGAGAWILDLTGAAHVCPYCRIQRSAIAIVGILMLLPVVGHWVVNLGAQSLIGFGFVVGAQMHFLIWQEIMKGDYSIVATAIWDNGFFLSAGALLIFMAQFKLIDAAAKQYGDPLDQRAVASGL